MISCTPPTYKDNRSQRKPHWRRFSGPQRGALSQQVTGKAVREPRTVEERCCSETPLTWSVGRYPLVTHLCRIGLRPQTNHDKTQATHQAERHMATVPVNARSLPCIGTGRNGGALVVISCRSWISSQRDPVLIAAQNRMCRSERISCS
jgi:hypothetical protein